MKTLPIKLPPFYEECLKYLSECSVSNKGVQNLSAADFLKTVLWNVKAICINGKSAYNHKLASIGIRKIGDLIAENNELITKHKLCELNISPLDALRLTCIIKAIPTEWRKCLKTCQHITAEPFNLQDQIQFYIQTGKMCISVKMYQKSFTRDYVIGSLLHLQRNSNIMIYSKMMCWIGSRYIAYCIVLPWTQNSANFNINF